MTRHLLSSCAVIIMALVCVGCDTAPAADRSQPSMRQAAKEQNIRCTAEQRRGCWAEFKCVEGSSAERAGCRATRRECLAACVR